MPPLRSRPMGSILPDKAKELYQIPADYEVWTAIAIGYKADPDQLPEALRKRKETPRQ
ncbi:MAG: hypothetical protein VCB26_00990 [Candidatus Hydrogenedentota bacterium]